MKAQEIDKNKYLSSTIYNPSPHRLSPDETPVGERQIPIVFTCENCGKLVSFKTSDFEKHNKTSITNLKIQDYNCISEFIKKHKPESINNVSLDFYCPECNQATFFSFTGGPSGYWGMYEFEIKSIIIIKMKE